MSNNDTIVDVGKEFLLGSVDVLAVGRMTLFDKVIDVSVEFVGPPMRLVEENLTHLQTLGREFGKLCRERLGTEDEFARFDRLVDLVYPARYEAILVVLVGKHSQIVVDFFQFVVLQRVVLPHLQFAKLRQEGLGSSVVAVAARAIIVGERNMGLIVF